MARPDSRPPKRFPLGALLTGALLVGSALLTLAWYDVLPGGWTLRGWVVPHYQRQAEAQLVLWLGRERVATMAARRGDS